MFNLILNIFQLGDMREHQFMIVSGHPLNLKFVAEGTFFKIKA